MLLTAKSILKFSSITILSILFVIYVFFQGKQYIQGPGLSITYPLDGTSTSTQSITLTGIAQRVAFLSLNERQIFVTDKGLFSEKLLLSPGYNIIEVKVVDRFKRERSERLHVTYVAESEDTYINLDSIGTTSPQIFEGDVPVSSTTPKEIIEEN